ncbi:MAG: TonB-dependent receptor [Bacteroidetes bacterium]|nr:MAG: TonB-dependent receptor [Bacteroidota bacterium]
MTTAILSIMMSFIIVSIVTSALRPVRAVRRRGNIRTFIAFFALTASFPTLYAAEMAQQTGTIEGSVVNAVTREPLIGATVQIVGTTVGAATDINGKFRFTNVPVGTYIVRSSALGYEPHTHTDVVVSTGRPAMLVMELRETIIEAEGVTVTSEYFQKSPDAPISVQTLGAEEIRRLPGGLEDVARAVAILPGVAQVQNGRNDLIVRGGAPSENLFVVDNIELANINHFGTQGSSGGPLSFINLDFVNETSFKTGGFGARYGDKLSSVLTIDLKDGRTDRFGGKATISASQFGLNLEGPTGEEGSFLFSARRSYLDFIFKAAGFGFVPEYWDFLGKVNYRVSPRDQITLLGIAALDDVKLFNDTEEKRYDNSRILSSDQTQFVGGATWRHLLTKGYTTVTLSQTYNGYSFIQNDSLLNPIFKSASDEYETTLRADVVLQVSRETELSFGASGKFVNFNSNIIFPNPFWTNFGQSLTVNATLDTTALKSAAYGQLSHALTPEFRLTGGVRMDYFNLIENGISFSPRLSASYAVTPVLTFTASVGRYHQAPSYIWLVANTANRKLDYVRVDQVVGGVEYLLRSDVKVSVETYRKNYSDYPASTTRPYLVLANTGSGFGGSQDGYASFGLDPLVSSGSGTSHGIELFLQKKLSEVPCYGLVSISWNETRFTALDGVSRPSAFDQRWILNLGGGYILNELWEFSGKFRYFTGRPYTPFNADGSQNAASIYADRIGANHSLDLRVDRRWNFERWNLITYIDIQNVYNRKALDAPIYDERTGTVKQAEGGIGLLPSIGVSAEF